MILSTSAHGNVRCAQALQNKAHFNDSEARNGGNHGFSRNSAKICLYAEICDFSEIDII